MKSFKITILAFMMLASIHLQACPGLNIGTHRKIPNMVSNGKVGILYDPNNDAFVYTPYDQTSEYIYIQYKGPEIKVSSFSDLNVNF